MIEPFVILGVIALSLGIGHLFVRRTWSRTAQRLGLEQVSTTGLEGDLEGFQVKIEKADKNHCVATIDGRGTIPQALKLGAENLFTRTMAPDILTGDSSFDYDARITGSEPVALAVLDRNTRALVLSLVVTGGAKVENGTVKLKHRRLADIERMVPQLLNLAKHLQLPLMDVPVRLAENTLHDHDYGVKLRNLRVLHEQYKDHPAAAEVSRKYLSSKLYELRLEAAIFLGKEGAAAAAELASAEQAGDDLRIRAIEHLANVSSSEDTVPLLEQLLDSPPVRVRRAAMLGLARYRHAPSLPRLLALIPHADAQTAEAIIRALSWFHDPAVEPGLIQLLEHSDTRVRIEAIWALAQFGTVQAVEPLLELTKTGLMTGGIKREAREAIRQIQTRIVGGERGQLSITMPTEHEGALSPAAAATDDGRLSIAESPEDPSSESA